MEITTPPLQDGGADPANGGNVATLSGSRLLGLLNSWWHQARDEHADNRREQAIDAGFYDHHQWSYEDLVALAERHQAPSVYNKVKVVIDWLIGTERRTRLDWRVSPRGPSDVEIAKIKQGLIKYLDDVNGFGWERSRAFADAVKVGIGWTEETITNDPGQPPVLLEWESWRNIWRDPASRHQQLNDCRYLHRIKTLDLDYGQAMFPNAAEDLRLASMTASRFALDIDGDIEERQLPQVMLRTDRYGRTPLTAGSMGSVYGDRRRVRIHETWFRAPESAKRIVAPYHPKLHGQWFDAKNGEQADMARHNIITLADNVRQRMRVAFWIEGRLLRVEDSPFKHDRYPFTPYWCYRNDQDGMEYGVIRGIRDPQVELNKRNSKALWHLSANQLIADEKAIEDWDEAAAEVARPDGIVKIKNGYYDKVRIERGTELAAAQVQMMELAAAHIHDGSGVNREQLGRDTNAASGRAILAKQSEGSVTTAELFDNYRLSFQMSGQKVLSLAEQYIHAPLVFRVTEDTQALNWMQINQPVYDEAGNLVRFENDITETQGDFIVAAQDWRESQRQAMAEQLLETLGKMPPEVALQMLDLVVDLFDIPGKAEFVKRIRAINGQSAPGEADTPEAIAARQQAQQRQQETEALEMRERTARVAKDEATATKLQADAEGTRVKTQAAALDAAGLIASAIPLAPVADQVMASARQPAGTP